MTATYNESVSAPTQGATGRIARVIGPVVDVEFPAGQVPDIYNALTTELTLNGRTRTITFETAQPLCALFRCSRPTGWCAAKP